jgi:hypothetical protein
MRNGMAYGTADRPNAVLITFAMLSLVQERVQRLRQEIADIADANRRYVHSTAVLAAEQERRLQWLKEIMDELRALTDWKET